MPKKLQIFISWSGERSQILARRLGEWLPGVVPDLQMFYSPERPGGVPWRDAIAKALKSANFAIVCVTKDNLSSAWTNFEAGALWLAAPKPIEVCPLLLDLEPGKIVGPLSHFQARSFNERSFKDLCKELAKKTGLDGDRLRYNFKAVWSHLERDIADDLRLEAASKRKKKP